MCLFCSLFLRSARCCTMAVFRCAWLAPRMPCNEGIRSTEHSVQAWLARSKEGGQLASEQSPPSIPVTGVFSIQLGGINKDKPTETNRGKCAFFCLQILLLFTAFSCNLQHLGAADFRRRPQETAECCRNPFVPFSVFLLINSTLFRQVQICAQVHLPTEAVLPTP